MKNCFGKTSHFYTQFFRRTYICFENNSHYFGRIGIISENSHLLKRNKMSNWFAVTKGISFSEELALVIPTTDSGLSVVTNRTTGSRNAVSVQRKRMIWARNEISCFLLFKYLDIAPQTTHHVSPLCFRVNNWARINIQS